MINRDQAETIVEDLNFELTCHGNYPTDTVIDMMRKLGEFVWDLDDDDWLTEAHFLFCQDFDLMGELY